MTEYNDNYLIDGTGLRIYKNSIINIEGVPYEKLLNIMLKHRKFLYDETKASPPEVLTPEGGKLSDLNMFSVNSEEGQQYLRNMRDEIVEEYIKEKNIEEIFVSKILTQFKHD